MTIKKRLITGGIWALSGKVLTILAVLAINILIARLLTPSEVGTYFLAFSIVSFASIFAKLGLNQVAVKLIAGSIGVNDPGRAKQSIIIMLVCLLIASLVVASVLYFGLGKWLGDDVFKSPMLANIMGLIALWVILTSAQALLAEMLRGFHDIFWATFFSGLAYNSLSSLFFAVIWLLNGHSSLYEIVLLSLVAGGTSTIIALILLQTKAKTLSGTSTLGYREVIIMTIPLLITNIMLFAISQADLWIVGMFRSSDDVAIYGAASRLVLLTAVPLLVIHAVAPPLIAEMYAQDKKQELERILRLMATIAGIPALIALIAFAFGSKLILGLVYGTFYTSAAMVLVILCVGQLINVWAGSCGLVLMLTGHQNTMMIITIISGIITVALSIVLIKYYGVIGVAIASALGLTIQNILMLSYAKYYTNIWTHMEFVKLTDVKQILTLIKRK